MQLDRRRRDWLSLSSSDWLLLLLVAALQLTICLVRSHGRLFWSDELAGSKVLGDPSFQHMLAGWRAGADSGGLTHYLFGRAWIDAFGLSELKLRLYSATGTFLAVVFIWIAGRKYYGKLAMAFAVSLVFFTTPSLLWQLVNGRFYGTLMAAAGLATLAYFRATEPESSKSSNIVRFALSNALLCGSHILGMAYSAAILLAIFAFDRVRRQWRPSLYLAGLSGWIVLPFSYRAIVSTTSLASTAFWTKKPTFADLVFGAFAFGKIVGLLAVVLLLYLVVLKLRKPASPTPNLAAANRLAVYLYAGSLFLVEVVIFAKSRTHGISIFSERYLLPLTLGVVLIMADLFTRAFPAPLKRTTTVALAAAMIVLCAAFGLSRRPYYELYPTTGLAQRIAERLPPEKNVVVTAVPLFLFLTRYEPTHHYIYLLDWDFDLAPGRVNGDHSGERLMENFKRAGYDSGSILSCDEILARYPSFTVLVFGDRTEWVQERLVNPSYEIANLGKFTEWFPFTIERARHIAPLRPRSCAP